VEAPGGVGDSPALSQVGSTWPVEGRMVGIVVPDDADLVEVGTLRNLLIEADVVPLLIASTGAPRDLGSGPVPVQRTYLTARSVELDAVVLCGALAATPGSSRHANAADATRDVDPRVVMLVNAAYRHGKAIAALNSGEGMNLPWADVPADAAGVVSGDAQSVSEQLLGLLAAHRAWERFAPMRSG
jgi:catalase